MSLQGYGNLSVGRGTDTHFERVVAPCIDGRALALPVNVQAHEAVLRGVEPQAIESAAEAEVEGFRRRRVRVSGLASERPSARPFRRASAWPSVASQRSEALGPEVIEPWLLGDHLAGGPP